MNRSSQTRNDADLSALVELGLPKPGDTHTQKVAPADATRWLEKCNYERQRTRSKNHVERIVGLMEEDDWDPSIGQIAFVLSEESGQVYNIDGQHTLVAIQEFGRPVRMDVRTFVRETEEDVAILFSRFNVGKRRTAKDNISAFRLDHQFDLSQTKIGKIASAVKFIEAGFRPPAPGLGGQYQMDKYGLMLATRDWAGAGEQFFPLVDGASADLTGKLRWRSVLSVALATTRHCPEKAKPFWRQVAWADKIGRYDPRRQLHDWLLTHYTRGRQDEKKCCKRKEDCAHLRSSLGSLLP